MRHASDAGRQCAGEAIVSSVEEHQIRHCAHANGELAAKCRRFCLEVLEILQRTKRISWEHREIIVVQIQRFQVREADYLI